MAFMSARGLFGFLAGLLVVGLLVGLGVGVYQAGIAQGIVDAGRFPAGANVPVAGYGWHGGPGIFGIVLGIFFLFLIFGLIRAAFWRGRGSGPGWGHSSHGWGPGWSGGPGGEGAFEGWRDERERRIADLHRRLHEEDGGGVSGSGSGPSAGGTPAR
jgi:hypothetical protein